MQIVYFASPMCSWCWGFSPVVEQLKNTFSKQVSVRLVLAPFRVDTVEPMDEKLREYVLQQWRNVNKTTGQTFDFTFDMGQDFVYDTKPACHAIKAFHKQLPTQELEYMHTMQVAFYTENLNITHADVLTDLAKSFPVDINNFKKDLYAKEVNDFLEQDFKLCEQLKIHSYPMLVGINKDLVKVLAHGYTPFTSLKSKIENWIKS